jgi:hypothetical protein
MNTYKIKYFYKTKGKEEKFFRDTVNAKSDTEALELSLITIFMELMMKGKSYQKINRIEIN